MENKESSQEPRNAICKHWKMLLGLLLFGLTVQTVLTLRSPMVETDGVRFVGLAKKLDEAMEKERFGIVMKGAHEHVGYPLLILAGKYCVNLFGVDDAVGQWTMGARLFPWLCGIVNILLVWVITCRLFDAKAALAAGLIYTVFPLFRRIAVGAYSDTPCLFCYLMAVWCIVEGIKRQNILWLILAAVPGTMAFWIRPEGIAPALVSGLVLLVMIFRSRHRRLAIIGLVITVSLVVVLKLPYLKNKGQFFTKNSMGLMFEDHETVRQVRGDRTVPFTAPVTVIMKRGITGISEIFSEFIEEGLRYILLLPLIVGIYLGRRQNLPLVLKLAMACLAGLHFAGLVAVTFVEGGTYVSHRHVMILSILSMPWIGFGLIQLGEGLYRILKTRFSLPARLTEQGFLWGFLAVLTICFLPKTFKPLHEKKFPLLPLCQWVRHNTDRRDRIASTTCYVRLYGDREECIFHTDLTPILQTKDRLDYDLLICEKCRWPEGVTPSQAFLDSFQEKVVPGISGGPRGIMLFVPRAGKQQS